MNDKRIRISADWAIIVVIGLIVGCFVLAVGAKAEAVRGFHHEHHHEKLHHWYQQLMRPDWPTPVSCCNSNDCTPTQAKRINGKWQAMKAGRWISIPDEKINREESVDTQAHICWYPSTKDDDSVLCFVKPGSAI